MPSTFNARDATAYERVMGRWSRRLAEPFIAFAGEPAGAVIEIGCGTGSLTERLLARPGLAQLSALDIAEDYVAFARRRLSDRRLELRCEDAAGLPDPDGTYDQAVSLLVLHLTTDPEAVVREMVRVVRPGGTVAAAVWDVAGGLPHARMFLDTAAMFDAEGAAMRARYLAVPLARAGEMTALWRVSGLDAVDDMSVAVRFDFDGFDDYWSGFLTGEGTMGGYVAGLAPARRDLLGRHVRAAYEGGARDGPRSFAATAWMCRGRVAAR